MGGNGAQRRVERPCGVGVTPSFVKHDIRELGQGSFWKNICKIKSNTFLTSNFQAYKIYVAPHYAISEACALLMYLNLTKRVSEATRAQPRSQGGVGCIR